MLTPGIVNRFIEAGKAYNSDSDSYNSLLQDLKHHDEAHRHWSEWDAFTKRMSDTDLIYLIKGLTLAETHYHWDRGSVSPVIRTFGELVSRGKSEVIEEVARWGLDHTKSQWNPFRDYIWQDSKEYYELRQKRAEEIAIREKEQQEASQRRKMGRIKHAERTLQNADEREAVLKKMSIMGTVQKLSAIAQDDSVTVDFFPDEWSEVEEAELLKLSPDDRTALINKINHRRRKAWKELKLRLRQLEKSNGET